MGLLRAAFGSIGGTLADQWIDFYTVPDYISQTAAVFTAYHKGIDNARGSNSKASESIISNGSRIIVPEGYGLLTFEDGRISSIVTSPGAYIWDSNDLDSKTLFVDSDPVSILVKQSWERFKYGGRPQSQQIALFINLKELPGNRFGTQSAIYWDDKYLNAQIGVTTRGTYTLKIIDPIVFVRKILPASFLQNGEVFDFTDPANTVADQLFNEVVASLAPALSEYTNRTSTGGRISDIQRDSVAFSDSLSKAVEEAYNWKEERGICIERVAIVGIEYDKQSNELLKTVQRADALAGYRGEVNLKASFAAGLESAGAADGSFGLLGMGMVGAGIGIPSALTQQNLPSVVDKKPSNSQDKIPESDELVSKLKQLKRAFDEGLISEDEYNSAKIKTLGL